MQELTKSQRARLAIREFKTITDSLAIRGFYRPSGRFGKSLENCLKELRPEIYGSMNDSRVVELKGLQYVIDRLPRGIEQCNKIILTDEEQFEDTPFKKIEPLKRRRTSYFINKQEFCFIISRGISEIYDIITHMTFLNIEAQKIYQRMYDDYGNIRVEWKKLEQVVDNIAELNNTDLDSAIWNMSIILGRTYHETREIHEELDQNQREFKSNHGLFRLIYSLGKRIELEQKSRENALVIYFTPSLMNIIGHQKHGKIWATHIKENINDLELQKRPLHIISANLHSVVNLIYGYGAMKEKQEQGLIQKGLYDFFPLIKDRTSEIIKFGQGRGLHVLPDSSGTNIHCQLIDTSFLDTIIFHPELEIDIAHIKKNKPLLLVMDYAFGIQAFELMEQLLKPFDEMETKRRINIGSISIMGKAGTLEGDKGDIMLATAHVCEGSSDNYIVNNDLEVQDFPPDVRVHVGAMATVLGTSLQNKDLLEMFRSDWKAMGLEMEGGHYQKAINASIIKGNIPNDVSTRYAYYASDNPLMTGNTLAAGAMGMEGVKPTYMITKIILEKILNPKEKSFAAESEMDIQES